MLRRSGMLAKAEAERLRDLTVLLATICRKAGVQTYVGRRTAASHDHKIEE